MDSLTHITLGAAIGEVTLGKKIGNKAIFYGAIIGSIPDFDVILSPFIEPTKALLFHRGISHSILFALLLIPLIAYALSKIGIKYNLKFKDWLLFTSLTYLSHIFIDCFNTYGTGIFEPFNNYRVAYDSMAIIDIFFLLPLLTFIIWSLLIPYKKRIRRIIASISLSIAAVVLIFSIINKEKITHQAVNQLKSQGLSYNRLITTPTPLTNFYWAVVAENENGFYVGYLRNFSDSDKVNFRFIPRNDEYINNIEENPKIKNLKRFTKGFYIVDKDSTNNIWMHDLRYAGLDIDNPNSYVFTFEIKEEQGKIEVKRTHPNRSINYNAIKKYFEKIF